MGAVFQITFKGRMPKISFEGSIDVGQDKKTSYPFMLDPCLIWNTVGGYL